ncbi:MAG TPA: methyltransferase domain-containing protein [Stellaceae bacterium]|nr:methyltransferase domain-containing protein [Stellaceae bacterium]
MPEPLHKVVSRYYGEECRVVEHRRTRAQSLFVVEAEMRGRKVRLLGTVGRTREVMEHSAMDLAEPGRLVFPYERMMLLALALAERRQSVLLLGLGGGAMLRHLEAYLPETSVVAVERDPAVIAIAREHFRVRGKIVRADAEEWVVGRRGEFDVVLVDLYDSGGGAPVSDGFWDDCFAALRPGGCMGVNWAGGWTGSEFDGTPLQRIARVMPRLPRSFLVAERGPRGNFVQLVPTLADFRLPSLGARLAAFAQAYRLPREDRDILQRCAVTARHPPKRQKARLRA